MIKKKYIKRMYVEVPICDKCGSQMEPTGMVLTTYPCKYPYKCSNSECDGTTTFWENELPGLKYEFDEEEDKEKTANKYKIIAIIGEAGTGKDTILKKIVNRFDISTHEIISYTSRSKRSNEKEGINYHFVSKEEFEDLINQHRMLEYAEFNGWYYGTGIDDIKPDKINIGVFNPEGIRQLKKNSNVEVIVWRITCRDDIRLKRQLNREDNPNVEEIIRRYNTDKEDFSNLDFKVDYITQNENQADLAGVQTMFEHIIKLHLGELD